VWLRGGILRHAENQNAAEQHEVNQEKRPDQGWTASVGRFADQSYGRDRDDEDGNSQDLGQVGRSAAHHQSRDHDKVAADVGGE